MHIEQKNISIKLFFRVDSSIQIGSGHVMRCLTLADKLRKQYKDISFICRELPGNMCKYIEDKGYKVYCLPYVERLSGVDFNEELEWSGETWQNDAFQTLKILKIFESKSNQCLIVDHYGLDEKWEQLIHPYVKKIMVIDDLANRRHYCDVLLDQNYYHNMDNRYDNLLPANCRSFLGPNYVLLREEFIEARKHLKRRSGKLERILIFFGGSDPTNETYKALRAVQDICNTNISIDVVVGRANPNKRMIIEMCAKRSNYQYHCQINNMAELMSMADLAIGAGGSTTWERCYLGLPGIVFCIADNQKKIAEDVDKYGAHILADFDLDSLFNIKRLGDIIISLNNHPDLLIIMGEKGMELVPTDNIDCQLNQIFDSN